eukprot:GILK01009144.1.p1 GENE.GILK01009144.1~~GILK01009144.1.p1  ORF type:complete len:539 (+),score=101.48 GILK01009144.1:40-1617(+)
MAEPSVPDERLALLSLSKEELVDRILQASSNEFKGAKETKEPKEPKEPKETKDREHSRSSSKRSHKKQDTKQPASDQGEGRKRKQEKVNQSFRRRHVALKIAYLGHKYQGYATQDHTEDTIEGQLFKALHRTCLISDRASSHYSRCARTDKGVSALGNVFSLWLKTKSDKALGVLPDSAGASQQAPVPKKLRTDMDEEGMDTAQTPFDTLSMVDNPDEDEMDYLLMLNRLLPDDIRIVGWAPVHLNFDARFNCLARVYKYFFVQEDLDIAKMQQAAQKLVGEHDFRNMCKIDLLNVSNFRRRILTFDIQRVEGSDSADPKLQMWEIVIHGFSFLWHQVRCMAAVLFMIGRHQEPPEIIDQLLDVDSNPRKPAYEMASHLPLLLYDCLFEDVKFRHAPATHHRSYHHLESQWANAAIEASIYLTMLKYFRNCFLPRQSVASLLGPNTLVDGVPDAFFRWSDVQFDIDNKLKGKPHVPLFKRLLTTSYEDRISKLSDKKRSMLKKGRPDAMRAADVSNEVGDGMDDS